MTVRPSVRPPMRHSRRPPASVIRAFLASFPAALAVAEAGEARQVTADTPLRVFLECAPCDAEFVRQTITYVAWMRDRQDADVHVIQRSEITGGAGRQHTLDFIGLQRFEGKADTLRYVQSPDATQDGTRRGLARVLAMGLVRYLADTPVAQTLNITVPGGPAGATTGATASEQVRDPWDAWVFSLSGNGNANGESSSTNVSVSTSFSANRVTEAWKLTSSVRGSYGQQTFEYALPANRGDTSVVSISRSYNVNVLLVKSVTGNTSVGLRGSSNTSTFGNTKFSLNLEPAVEYNLFPYSESTRRAFTFTYGAGATAQTYREETIYSLMEETRAVHSLAIAYSTRQTWGNLNFGVNGRQYFHDMNLYNLNFSVGTSVNIVRGLSFNVSGNYEMVRDQLNLPKRNLTPEEVLLRQRAVATNYRYFTFFGLTYRFGSSVQSVVNSRF